MIQKTNNYVNNKEFTKMIIKFVDARKEDETVTLKNSEEGNYIGFCVMEICNNLARKANFVNYTYRDEMISDGIENCIKATLNFDYEKSKNAFGYFTQIAFHAFIRRIQKEKKHADRKLKLLSDPKTLNEIISKQFSAGIPGSEHEDNIQHFVDQMQATLVESGQLMEMHQVMPSVKKPKELAPTPISKYLEANEWL